jgi:tetratricopeptide (TPR) repeat protein
MIGSNSILSHVRNALLVLALVSAASLAGRALAQSPDAHAVPAATVEAARALYVEGLALRQRGELAASLDRLQRAHALYVTPIITLELGQALLQLARRDEAQAAFASVDALPVRPGESEKAQRAREDARKLAAELGPARAPEPDGPAPDAAVVLPAEAHVDAPAPAAALPEPALETNAASITAAPPAAPSVHTDSTARAQHTRRWLIAGIAVTGVGLATGAATGLATVVRAKGLRRNCEDSLCPPDAGLQTTLRLGSAANVGFAVAGAGVVMSAVALLLQPEPRSEKSSKALALWRAALPGGVSW